MKKILVLCMIFTMSFSMFACGSRNADADEGASNAAEQQEQDGEQDSAQTVSRLQRQTADQSIKKIKSGEFQTEQPLRFASFRVCH